MKWHVFILALLSAVALFVNGQCIAEDDNVQHTEADNSMSRNWLYEGQGIFTLKLLEAINEATSTENILFSPYSLYHVLLLLYFGAKSDTEKILRKGMELHGTEDKPLVWQAYDESKKSLVARFTENSDILFTSADKMFFDKSIRVEECMEAKFFDDIEMLDLVADPESQRIYINNWVENKTRGEIKDLLEAGALDKTILAVANAAYFKGNWQTRFEPEQTKPEIFYVSPGRQIFVDMMHVEGTFNHAWNRNIDCHILELPYKGEDKSSRLSMFVLLPPAEPNTLDKLLTRLTSGTDILSEVVGNGISQLIDVKLPKFSIEQSVDMKPVLYQLGMGHIFEATADFTGFSKQGQVGFDELQQKSKITVNEEGSTAASATIAFVSYSADDDDDPIMFHCNRPFIFLIYDYATQAVLFNGIYRQPVATAHNDSE